MKIVYISDVDISLPNGPGVNEREFVWALFNESELRNDQSFFLIPQPTRKLDFELKNVEYFKSKALENVLGQGLKVLSITWHLSKLILRKVRNSDIDLFVIRLSINFIFVMLLLAILRQKYSIKTLEDIYSFHRESFTLKRRYFLFIFRKVLGIILKRAILIDVCTQQFYESYKNRYSLKNIAVIENSVNVERFYIMDKGVCKKKCRVQKFKKIVGYCGGYPSTRGAKQLVAISKRLIEKYPDCGILIIGDDSQLHIIKEMARNLGTEGKVIFKGIINYEDLNSYMNCLDVGVALPTDEKKLKFCGNSSQKIRQYLACGVPIICPEGTNKSIIQEKIGLEVPPNDLDRIFEVICFWFDKSESEKEAVRIKCYLFAKNNLSTKVTFKKRYDAWKRAIGRV